MVLRRVSLILLAFGLRTLVYYDKTPFATAQNCSITLHRKQFVIYHQFKSLIRHLRGWNHGKKMTLVKVCETFETKLQCNVIMDLWTKGLAFYKCLFTLRSY